LLLEIWVTTGQLHRSSVAGTVDPESSLHVHESVLPVTVQLVHVDE
jgi:hypothetical protein